MKNLFLLVSVIFLFSFLMPAQDSDLRFWDRVEFGVLGGPLFPGGDEADPLSTGYYIGVDARYQLFRFMAVGFSVGRNSWDGQYTFDNFLTKGVLQEEGPEISSGKTNTCLSLHFGPSAPTWTTVTGLDRTEDRKVEPYRPGMFVPFFIFEIGPYFWDWSETDPITGDTYEESGSDLMIRGTLSSFYQASKLISITLGLSYTLYDTSAEFTSFGVFGGLRFNMGQIVY